MQTVGNLKTNDGTLIPIQVDETISVRRYQQQISIALYRDYYPINSGYAPRATWPTGGCPYRISAGQSILVTYAEAKSLYDAGGCSLGGTDGAFLLATSG